MGDLLWRQLDEIQSGSSHNSTDFSVPSDDDDDQDAIEVVKIFLLPCITIVACVVLLTHRLDMIVEKFCCCFHSATLPPDEFDQGPVARKAGLWSLRQSERMLILKHIFEKTTFAYKIEERCRMHDAVHENKATDTCTVDTQEMEEDIQEFTQGVGSETGEDQQPSVPVNIDDMEAGIIERHTDPSPTDDTASSTSDDDQEQVCCICLAECEKGCQLMMGTRCNHFFHSDCCMEWLQKHDHCPYCRKEMMSPSEMREAAIQVLGPDRVISMRQGEPVEETTASSHNDLEAGMNVESTRPDSSGDGQ